MTKTQEPKKPLRYEAPPKPVVDSVIKVRPDASEFSEPDKAAALIQNLKLAPGDVIREDGDEYVVNPRYELGGTPPARYKEEIDHFKALCTPGMVKVMTQAIQRKTKDEKFYHRFEKRLDARLKLLKDTPHALYFTAENKNVVTGSSNCIYWLTTKEEKKEINEFVLAWFGKPIPDQREWREENDGEYRVLTDSEADTACDDYLDDDREMWAEAVRTNRTDEGFEDWKETVRNSDGRGGILNHYDGNEEEEEINGVTYYIYRTN